jgi:tetratricopeptide (TPR) repeat protein
VEALKEAARSVRLGPANYARALERIRAARELDPKLWEAAYDEGWLDLKLGKPEAAVQPLERAQGIVPGSVEVTLLLGRAYERTNRPGDAARLYKSFLDRKPSSAARADELRVQLGASLRRAGRLDEALDVLQRTLRSATHSAVRDALRELGLVYQAKHQLELADLVLHRALELDDKSKAAAEVWNNLGLVALDRRRDQEAFADFDQAVKLDPQLTVARRNKAIVYLDCGDYGRALAELKRVSRSDPDDASVWVALGVAARGAGELAQAELALKKALELDPDHADALYDFAILEMDFKKAPARARDSLEHFLRVAPAAHAKRADAQARLKELAKSGQTGDAQGRSPPS